MAEQKQTSIYAQDEENVQLLNLSLLAGDHAPAARVVAELEVPVPENVAGIMQRRLDGHQHLGCKPHARP